MYVEFAFTKQLTKGKGYKLYSHFYLWTHFTMIVLINHEEKKFKQKTDETKKTNVLNIQTVFIAFRLQ